MANCRLCEGKKFVVCPKCNGSGVIGEGACPICEAKTPDGSSQTKVTCPRCGGSGED